MYQALLRFRLSLSACPGQYKSPVPLVNPCGSCMEIRVGEYLDMYVSVSKHEASEFLYSQIDSILLTIPGLLRVTTVAIFHAMCWDRRLYCLLLG